MAYKYNQEREQQKRESGATEASQRADGSWELTFGSPQEVGQYRGRSRAQQLYGMNSGEVGAKVQDIVKMRKDALNQENPATQAIRRDVAGQERSLAAAQKKTGVTGTMAEAQKRQVQKAGQEKAAITEYQGKQQALSEYQKLIGNIAANSGSLEMGFGSLYGVESVQKPEEDKGLFGWGVLGL